MGVRLWFFCWDLFSRIGHSSTRKFRAYPAIQVFVLVVTEIGAYSDAEDDSEGDMALANSYVITESL